MRLSPRAEAIAAPSEAARFRQSDRPSKDSLRHFRQRREGPLLLLHRRLELSDRSCAVPAMPDIHGCRCIPRTALSEIYVISWSFVQVAFPLQFPFANAVRLVPMYFCQPYVTASKSNAGHTLHLPPTALAVATPKTFEIANPLTGGNCLKNRDFSDNLKVHCEIVPFKECPPLSRITFRMSSRSQRREATLVTVCLDAGVRPRRAQGSAHQPLLYDTHDCSSFGSWGQDGRYG
jgi:hypothetical protein